MSALTPAYRPRRPTETVLYRVVREHLETFLAYARESYQAPLPRYVEDELRSYLRCGVFAHGFIRARCETCGHDLLVAFSCKGRGVCPSCAGRRMANTAAHLVDRVLPAVPVRQWVLSLPFELRALAAFRADVLSGVGRIFAEEIFVRQRSWAKQEGLGAAPSGAITFVQRFGSSVNLNVHFHVVVLDGVFTRDERGGPQFHPTPPPTIEALGQALRRVSRRVVLWLARQGRLSAQSSEEHVDGARAALDACAAIAMRRGSLRALGPELESSDGETVAPEPPANEGAVEHDGFNLHASVAIAGDDDLGRERLCRYGARPPLALDRLRRLPDGRLAYRIKKLRGGGAKHRVMTPLEFLARLAALVPPPRYPLVRYHGVLAPRSPWRRDIVPRARQSLACESVRASTVPEGQPAPSRACGTAPKRATPMAGWPAPLSSRSAAQSPAPECTEARAEAERHVPPATGPGNLADGVFRSGAATVLAPNILAVKHWNRLLGGLLYAATPRVDWATLLRRSFEVDVLVCGRCGGRLRVLGDITEPMIVRLVLESLGMPTEAPRPARARDPTDLLGDPGAEG